MKKMEKYLSLLLAAAMLLGLLAACGSSDTGTAEAEETEETETAEESTLADETEKAEETVETAVVEETEETAEEESTEQTEEPAEESETAAAETAAAVLNYPLTDEDITLTMWIEQPSLGPLRAWGGDYGIDIFEDYASIQQAAEITGVTVSFENANSDNAQTLLGLHIAAGDWADMIASIDMYYSGGVTQAWSDGVVLEISDYLEEYAPAYSAIIYSDEELTRGTTDTDGSVYQLATLLEEFVNSEGTLVRQDWLDQVGMEVPTTLDELYDVLIAFQTEIGCDNPFYFNSACNQLLTSYNLAYYTDIAESNLAVYQIDGTVYSNFTSEAFYDWLQNMHQWYEEGLIDPDFISVSSNNMGGHDEELLAADDVGVWWGNVNSITNYYSLCPAEDFEVASTFIYATDEQINHTTSTSLIFGGGVAISTTCEHVELALGWLDFWYTEEGIRMANYGVEGVSYNMVDGEVQYTEVITDSEYDLDPSVALKLYSIAGAAFGVQREDRTYPFYIEKQLEAAENWTAPCDGAWAYPDTTLTTDESAVIAKYAADITTYVSEYIPKIIMGVYDLDEIWDDYVEEVNTTLGLLECLECYQSALDRYMGVS